MKTEHLYIHVPFCARRCVYCDFSIAVRSRVPVDEFLTSLEREWTIRHGASTFDLATLYLGGGTPSKLGAEGIKRLLEVVRRRAALRQDAEITLEANPEDVSTESVRAWRAAGVNRISLGVQSFEDEVLVWMHRTHHAATALRAVQVLREEGIDNLSIDLIFATPSTVARSWEKDLEKAVALELPHLSVYGLTVEQRAPLGRWIARHDLVEAPEEAFEHQFLEAHAKLTAAGFEHYEVSNYGRPTRHSRHNWAYWNRSAYAGLGPSAHEFDGRARRWNTEAYAHWTSQLARGQDPLEGREDLAPDQADAEEVYLGLRTSFGVALSEQEGEHVRRWIEVGWAKTDGDSRLRLTTAGWLRLDSLASALTMLRSR